MKNIFLLFLILVVFTTTNAQSTRSSTDALGKTVHVNTGAESGCLDNLLVYPNPVVDQLKVTFKSNFRCNTQIMLFNNIGKLVFNQESIPEPGSNQITIDIKGRSIEPGIYFVQVIADNEVFTKKIIVK
jgi:hypothetical protein